MISLLICGSELSERQKKISQLLKEKQFLLSDNNPDLIIIKPEPSIGIAQIRNLQKFLSRKPIKEKIKVCLIPEAEKITIPGQNAFLKTLEEAPVDSLIILSTLSEDKLLSTVVSRCQIIRLAGLGKKLNNSPYLKILESLLKSNLAQRLKIIEPETKTREDSLIFLESMIKSLRDLLLGNDKTSLPFSKITLYITALSQAHKLLGQNVNNRLVMDNLVIQLN